MKSSNRKFTMDEGKFVLQTVKGNQKFYEYYYEWVWFIDVVFTSIKFLLDWLLKSLKQGLSKVVLT